MNFWQSCRVEEKFVFLVCGAILVFCIGAQWGRNQQKLPPLFEETPLHETQAPKVGKTPPKTR